MKDVQPDSDLWWFWNDAVGDMGLHAAPLEPSTAGAPDGAADDRRIRAASRYRAIEICVGGLPEEQVRLLELVHRPVPPAIRPQMAKLGNLAHAMIDKHGPHWVLEQLHSNGAELTKAVAEMRGRVHKALEAFREEMREWKRATREAKRRR